MANSHIAVENQRWLLQGDMLIEGAVNLLAASQKLELPIEIDFAGVKEIDTTAISLILEWKRRAKTENKSFACVHMPRNLGKLSQLYGVANLL